MAALYLPLIETIAPEMGAELVLSRTCPVSRMLVGEGLGAGVLVVELGAGVPVVEGDVGVLPPSPHDTANVTRRTPQPRLAAETHRLV